MANEERQEGDGPANAAPYHVHAHVPGPDPWATACGRRVPRDALAWPGSSEPDCPACRVECGLEEEAPEAAASAVLRRIVDLMRRDPEMAREEAEAQVHREIDAVRRSSARPACQGGHGDRGPTEGWIRFGDDICRAAGMTGPGPLSVVVCRVCGGRVEPAPMRVTTYASSLPPVPRVYDVQDLYAAMPSGLVDAMGEWVRRRGFSNGEAQVVYLTGEDAQPDNGGLPADVSAWIRERLGAAPIRIWVRW